MSIVKRGRVRRMPDTQIVVDQDEGRKWDPKLLTLDDGREFDTSTLDGLGIKAIGREQNRLRREKVDADDFDYNFSDRRGFGPGRFKNTLPDPTMDAFFGLMQAKENAANSAGLNFGIRGDRGRNQANTDPNAFGWRPSTAGPDQQPLYGPNSIKSWGGLDAEGRFDPPQSAEHPEPYLGASGGGSWSKRQSRQAIGGLKKGFR